MDEFLKESRNHGWPSFRDQETNWDNVRDYPMGKLLVLMEHISVTIYQMGRVVDTVLTWYVSLVDLQMGKNYD